MELYNKPQQLFRSINMVYSTDSRRVKTQNCWNEQETGFLLCFHFSFIALFEIQARVGPIPSQSDPPQTPEYLHSFSPRLIDSVEAAESFRKRETIYFHPGRKSQLYGNILPSSTDSGSYYRGAEGDGGRVGDGGWRGWLKHACIHADVTHTETDAHTLTPLYQSNGGQAHSAFINTLINFSWSPFPACLINWPPPRPTPAWPRGELGRTEETTKLYFFFSFRLSTSLRLLYLCFNPVFIIRFVLCDIHNSAPPGPAAPLRCWKVINSLLFTAAPNDASKAADPHAACKFVARKRGEFMPRPWSPAVWCRCFSPIASQTPPTPP